MATRTFFWSSIYHWNGDFIAFLLVLLFRDYCILRPSHFFFVIALILLSRTRGKSIPITFFSCSSAEEKLLCNSELIQNSGPNIMHYTLSKTLIVSHEIHEQNPLPSGHFSYSVLSNSLQPHGLQPARLLSTSPTPRAYSNTFLSHQWCHPTISSSVLPFISCLQSFPASGSFPRSLFFASSGQSIGVSASTAAIPMNIQDWFPLGLTGWISLQSKGLSRVFSNTTDQKHQFLSTQLSLESNSHINTWLLGKP